MTMSKGRELVPRSEGGKLQDTVQDGVDEVIDDIFMMRLQEVLRRSIASGVRRGSVTRADLSNLRAVRDQPGVLAAAANNLIHGLVGTKPTSAWDTIIPGEARTVAREFEKKMAEGEQPGYREPTDAELGRRVKEGLRPARIEAHAVGAAEAGAIMGASQEQTRRQLEAEQHNRTALPGAPLRGLHRDPGSITGGRRPVIEARATKPTLRCSCVPGRNCPLKGQAHPAGYGECKCQPDSSCPVGVRVGHHDVGASLEADE